MPVPSAASMFATPVVRWLGEGVPSGRRGISKHFRKFSLGGEEFCIGDCILISRQENISESCAKEDCYVARMTDLYEKELVYNRAEVQRFAEVRWYWQKQEAASHLRKLLKGYDMEENEVILDLTNNFERDIDLETVVGKCKVLHIEDDAALPSAVIEENNNSDDIETFFSRRAYNGKGFEPISGKEYEEHKPVTPKTPRSNRRHQGCHQQEITPNGSSVSGSSRPRLNISVNSKAHKNNVQARNSSARREIMKASPCSRSSEHMVMDSDVPMKTSPLICLQRVASSSSYKSTLLSPLERMARLNQKTVVNMLLHDSSDDTDSDDGNSVRPVEHTVEKCRAKEILNKPSHLVKIKHSKRQRDDYSELDLNSDVCSHPTASKRMKVVLDKVEGNRDGKNRVKKTEDKSFSQKQVEVKKQSPVVLLKRPCHIDDSKLLPEKQIHGQIKNNTKTIDKQSPMSQRSPISQDVLSTCSSSACVLTSAVSPCIRKSIFEAPDCEKIMKTPEAKRKGSDKTPESLDAGRRRLSVNLFGKLGSSSSLLFDGTGAETPKCSIKTKDISSSLAKTVLKFTESEDLSDDEMFANVTSKKLMSVCLESSPRRSSSRSRNKPQRFTPERDHPQNVVRASSHCHSPRVCPTGQVYSPKTNSVFKKEVASTPEKTFNSVRTSERRTPKRAASLKKMSYAELDQLDDDQEASAVKNTRKFRQTSANPKLYLSTPKKRFLEYGGDDSDADEDYDVDKDCHAEQSEDSDSDFDNPRKECRTRRIRSIKDTSKKVQTPQPSKCRPHKAVPNLPSRIGSKSPPRNDLEEARARLHVSAIPHSLPCREKEFSDIIGFVESKIQDGTGGCMYISGVPGTGKTATVKEVMKVLEAERDDGNLPDFRFVEINGMKLTEPRQAYVELLKNLTGRKVTADHAAGILNKMFTVSAPRSSPVVLLVDELDLLWTRKQDVMYNIFDWPTKDRAKLIVLAVANTMDLPERMMIKRVASRLGLTRMTFQPYTFRQLEEIVASRLRGLQVFEGDAVQLAARKVAAVSGDARRALDICRRSTEIAETRSEGGQAVVMVSMSDINAAVEEMFCSPKILAIRNVSLQEQLLLKAIVAEFQRSGVEEVEYVKLYDQHRALCRFEGIHVPTMTELSAMCYRLGSMRLLLTEPGCCDLSMRLRLNISQDDIMYALRA